jgi:hypothetical protein
MHSRTIALGILSLVHGFASSQQLAPLNTSGTIFLNGQSAGSYAEKAALTPNGVDSSLETTIIFNRLGSKVIYKVAGTFRQDQAGNLLAAHCEATSSQTSVLTDAEVKGDSLTIKVTSGDHVYSRMASLHGTLVGPEGYRRLLSLLSPSHTQETYQTFLCETGDIGTVSTKFLSTDDLSNPEGGTIGAVRVEQSMQGFPGAATLWLDHAGHMLKMKQDSPFGPMEMAESKNNAHQEEPIGATLPDESYEATLARSNIRIPNPREAEEVELRLTQRKPELGWPNFSDDNQKVIEEGPITLVVRITKPAVPDRSGPAATAGQAVIDLEPTPLLQSDDQHIATIAQQVTKGISDPWRAALALQKWTATNMTFDTGIAVAPASEVVKDRHGTCVGYSILLASLLRADHLPSRLKMGYVYDGGVWGGHAWVEVLLSGHWIPLDAAEYAPGPSDAARISAITMTGQSGGLEHIGELAKLYGNIDIQVLSFTVHGKRYSVPMDAKDSTVEGNTFRNPWLNVTVSKPPSMTFTHLSEHWPDTTILQMEGSGETIALNYSEADPELTLQAQANEFFTKHGISGVPQTVRWGNRVAIRNGSDQHSAIVTIADGTVWAVTATGDSAKAQLTDGLKNVNIGALRLSGDHKR